jgi:5-methylcytosine-specific restriction enzyme subunit McrC
MPLAQQLERAPILLVELTEWGQLGPKQDPRLRGRSLGEDSHARRLAEDLRGRLEIREGYDGIEIAATSFVGRVDVGPLRIAIRPKLPAMPLARLLRYAYRLRDVSAIEETGSPTTRNGLHDLLIELLAKEVEELLHRGLARRYVPLFAKLESPRGRLLINEVIRRGGVREAKLPCLHFERRVDWHLNQVLRAGLESAAQMAEDRHLRQRVRQLSAMFGDVDRLARLRHEDIERAERDLTRLTAVCRPALTIIKLINDTLGIAFDSSQPQKRMPGFLFDMNVFFERLLSRFLRDNLTVGRIKDQETIRSLFAYSPDANPRGRKAPAPRPDFALFSSGHLNSFLDAKYRDLWDKSLPAEWLYQLSIYALASPRGLSVLLYASMAEDARDERIEVRQPIAWSSNQSASVILRPVPLSRLAAVLDPDLIDSFAEARRQLANGLVISQVRKGGVTAA